MIQLPDDALAIVFDSIDEVRWTLKACIAYSTARRAETKPTSVIDGISAVCRALIDKEEARVEAAYVKAAADVDALADGRDAVEG